MSLAVAGAIFQGVLRNALASTDVLGIGKGAGFFACMAISLGLKEPISLWAMVGGLLAGTIIYILTKKTNFKNAAGKKFIFWLVDTKQVPGNSPGTFQFKMVPEEAAKIVGCVDSPRAPYVVLGPPAVFIPEN